MNFAYILACVCVSCVMNKWRCSALCVPSNTSRTTAASRFQTHTRSSALHKLRKHEHTHTHSRCRHSWAFHSHLYRLSCFLSLAVPHSLRVSLFFLSILQCECLLLKLHLHSSLSPLSYSQPVSDFQLPFPSSIHITIQARLCSSNKTQYRENHVLPLKASSWSYMC